MDDLISRKAVAEKMKNRRDYVGRPSDPDCIIADEPSVHAVPLDKLCELCEETGTSVPCAICSKIMPEWCKKNNNFPLSWDEEFTCPSWKATLTKWMEGLDDHR